METKRQSKVIRVNFHGHTWPVYPLKCRQRTIYRVVHRVNGERRPKTFSSLAKAKADAKSILKDLYAKGGQTIHLTEDEKLDWKAATGVLKQYGIRSSLETVCRHYGDLATTAGGEGLMSDIIRKHSASRSNAYKAITLGALRDEYIATMKSQGRSTRYIEALKSYCGIFVREVRDTIIVDKISREMIQRFLDTRKVGSRGKQNFAEALRTMFQFAKNRRVLPEDWNEIEHVTLPLVKHGAVPTYSPDDLKKLFAAASDEFVPCLALAAFGGMRSAEIERVAWDGIRLLEDDPKDKIVNLDAQVTKTNSRRSFLIHDTLRKWLSPHFKPRHRVWRGGHHQFYRLQQQVAQKAGVQWRQNALRHTCISAKIAIESNVPKAAYETGTSVQMIKTHYLDLMPPSAAQAWFAVTPYAVHLFKKKEDR